MGAKHIRQTQSVLGSAMRREAQCFLPTEGVKMLDGLERTFANLTSELFWEHRRCSFPVKLFHQNTPFQQTLKVLVSLKIVRKC
jgi:hypothetical protein